MKKGKVLIIQLSLAFLLLIGTFIFAFIYPNTDSSDVFMEESALVGTNESVTPKQTATPPVVVPSEETEEETEEAFQDYDITLMSVGDNLLHMGVIKTGKQTDGTYDYSFLFDGMISDFLDYADIKMIALNPYTREKTSIRIIASRNCFPQGPSKETRLQDVIFSGGLVRQGNGKAWFYAGVSDAEAHRVLIPDPFLEYEML